MPRKSTPKKVPVKEVAMPLWFEERQNINPDTWKILQYRAQEIQEKKELDLQAINKNNYLGFSWGSTRCYLSVNVIEEVRDFEYLEPIPLTPEIVIGILNLRGEVLPVFDLRQLWKLSSEEITEDSKILILDKDNMKFGYWVDSVLGTFELDDEKILPAHQYSGEMNNQYTFGVFPQGQELWLVLNDQEILKSKELIISEKR